MTVRNLRTIALHVAVALFLLLVSVPSRAQENGSDAGPGAFISRPAIGVQTIFFTPDSPPAQPIFPADDRNLIGGGFSSSNNALRLTLELIPNAEGMFRIPISFEAYQFIGKTTFSITRGRDKRKVRWLFRHTAEMFSIGTGVTAAFFSKPNLYVTLEGRLNYLPPATFYNRQYYLDNNETVKDTSGRDLERAVTLDEEPMTRFGGFGRIGTQVDFFDPLLLDFSVGFGILNLFGKETDPKASRHILTLDTRDAPEETIGYFGLALSVIWEL
jgi:hypothetical protein